MIRRHEKPISHYTEEKGIHKGVEWMILICNPGHRCGYVRIQEEHEFFGVDYMELQSLDAHGGLTFSGKIRQTEGWWIGFDCNHFGDSPSRELCEKYYPDLLMFLDDYTGTVKQLGYVRAEVISLCEQVAK